jgi:hypothetical protein
LARRLAPLTDREWAAWLPTIAYAIEHRDGMILVDAGASPHASSGFRAGIRISALRCVSTLRRMRRPAHSYEQSESVLPMSSGWS